MGLLTKIRDEFTNYRLFKQGAIPPLQRFNEAYVQEIASIMKRYYSAAEIGDRRADWNPSVINSRGVYRLEYKRCYARSKRAYDDNPYARSTVRVLQSQIAGRGIYPKAKPIDSQGNYIPDLARILNADFERFNEECMRPAHDSFFEMQNKYIANCCYSGGMFLNTVPAPTGSMLPFAFQVIDQGLIDFSRDSIALPTNTGNVYNGVRVNQFGEPQEYYFQDIETYAYFTLLAANAIHCYEKNHCNQFIGIPWLTPVLSTLWDLQQLLEDKLIASRIQAAIALWIKDTNKFPNKALKNDNGNVSWAPGAILKSPDKPEVLQASDSIKETLGALTELYIRQVASGMGISYQEMVCDLAGANFSSARLVTIDRRRYYRKKQQANCRQFGQPIYNKFVQWEFLSGRIPGKNILDFKENQWGLCRVIWTPDKWEWVDPETDIKALIAEKDAGWLTDEEYCAMAGKDREMLYNTLEEEKTEKESRGIVAKAVDASKPFQTKQTAPGAV